MERQIRQQKDHLLFIHKGVLPLRYLGPEYMNKHHRICNIIGHRRFGLDYTTHNLELIAR